MTQEFSDKELKSQLSGHSKEAERLLNDEDKMEKFLERMERKLQKVPMVGNKLSSIPMLISLARAYIKKEYREIPIGSMIAVVSALLYFGSPVDLIPDFIPVAGYLDDAAVIALVWQLVEDDVAEYKQWQKANGKRVLEDE